MHSSGWRLAMPIFYRSTVIAFDIAIETSPMYVSARRDTLWRFEVFPGAYR